MLQPDPQLQPDAPLLATTSPQSTEPQGLPSEYGLPDNCGSTEKRRWERQELYLHAYAKLGSHHKAQKATGVHWSTQVYWEEQNTYGFRERLKAAIQEHRELLEEENIFAPLQAASPRDKLLHPVLPIFALKGAWREKYGDQVTVQDNSGVRQVLQGLRALAARQPQPPLIEGQPAREISPAPDSAVPS